MFIRQICSVLIALLPLFSHAQSISVAEARVLPAGAVVTVRGVVTNGSELGPVRFLQDGTAGIAAYPGSGSAAGFEQNVSTGDSVEISGTLTLYHGLLEISPVTGYQVISSGHPLPIPKAVALSDLSDDLEGQLVRLSCISFDDAGGLFSGSGTYALSDAAGDPSSIYLRNESPLQGFSIPAEPVQLTAIVSQYDDFQLLPRGNADINSASCLFFLQKPTPSDLSTTGFTLNWQTNLPATSKLHYGPTPALGSELILPGSSQEFSANLTGLQPGSLYWAQVEATQNGATVFSETAPFSTVSSSSGQIKVFFNHAIDISLVGGLAPSGQSFAACRDETIARIDAAQQTLDVTMYNNNRSDITYALKQAQARGVRVRYIASSTTDNTALSPAPAFPVVYGNDEALMHDKFMVIDAALPDKAWVMTGSMNWTTGNMTEDYNNLLFIQDQSLALAYTLEFEEMWGSTGALPNLANGRFGSAKTNNTPHYFLVGGIPVQSWFSPSDGVTGRIVETIQSADDRLDFALFTFTKNEPGNALLDAYNGGVAVRGLIENIDDPGCEYDYLLANGVPVFPHPGNALLHHKYVEVDAFSPNSDPAVLTGSHNWSYTAETANDENTLVIHNADIARLYAAEFQERWSENATATLEPDQSGFCIGPNPVSDVLTIYASDKNPEINGLEVFDALGRPMRAFQANPGRMNLGVQSLPAGYYLLRILTEHGVAAIPFQKI